MHRESVKKKEKKKKKKTRLRKTERERERERKRERGGWREGGREDENRLLLNNSPSDQSTFCSRRWHTTYTQDRGLCTEGLHGSIRREVGEQLGGSDHRPVFLTLNLGASTEATFPRGTTRRSIGPSLNTELALSPRTSPSKAQTSTWWQTQTRPYSKYFGRRTGQQISYK